MLLIAAVVMAMHCWGAELVAGGASLVIFTADQIVITFGSSVGADSFLHTVTPVFYEGTLQPDTASVMAGVGGITSKISAVLVGVMTPPP